MYHYGERSEKNLITTHPKIQAVFREVIKEMDCTIICGERTIEEQVELKRSGKSMTLNSKHIKKPGEKYCRAVDAIVYHANKPNPIDWNDSKGNYHFAGFVLGIAATLGIKLIWGGNWNGNMDLKDQNFFDLVHFELASSEN